MFKQTWWNDNIKSKINEFKQWVGDETAESKQYIKSYLRSKKYQSFLDVGCGTATMKKCIKDELNIEYTGVDSCTYFIEMGLKANIKIIDSDVRNMSAIADSSYDFGFARHIFEHQESFNDVLSELIRVSTYEACHIFFIKPGQTEEKNFDPAVKLFHNRYSIHEINAYLKTNKKVQTWEWVHINNSEIALHMTLATSKMLLVTAYYPVKTNKHTVKEYSAMMDIFFECVTCPVIFFCSSETYEKLKSRAKSNVQFVQREFNSFEITSEPWKSRWESWYDKDPEKHLHSPELYAVWAAKQEFVREAMKLVDTDIYVWCDAGCFRNKRPGSFEYTAKYVSPGKITCLEVSALVYDGIKMIGGGVLAGDREAWTTFSQNYLNELEQNLHGKDQVIFHRVLNDNNAKIITPTREYGEPWFYLTYIFSIAKF